MAQEIRDVVFNIQVRTQDGKVKIDGLTKGFVKAESAFKKMQTTLKTTNNAINKTGINTGLANTAVLEFGRTVSDAPYGIQGMGNNITQLVTIMGQLGQEAKETGISIGKSLRNALIGPLGIVIAVQVVVAAFEIYNKTIGKSKKETENLKKSLDEIAETYNNQQAILSALGNAAVYSPEARKTFSENMKEVKEYLEAAETVGKITPAVVEEAVRLGNNLLEARKKAAIAEKEYLELIKDPNNDRVAAGIKLAEVFRELTEAEQAMILVKQEDVVVTAEAVEQTREQIDAVKELEKTLLSLGDDLFTPLFPSGAKAAGAKNAARTQLIEVGEDAVEGFQQWAKETESAREGGEDDWLLRALGMTPGQFEAKAEMVQKGLDAVTSVIDAQFERDLALEEAKTVRLNDQLRQRLRNEQLTAVERDKINQEIAKNEAALVEQQNKIEEKRFKLNKAQGIANAVINTSVAVSKVLPNVPLAAFIGALGAAQVATIASQAFVPSPSPTPSLTAQGGGPAESQSPAFNVIGAGGQSQLAAAVAGQQRQPVKAYVVAGEVTTAQSLERNKISEASI